MRLIIATFAFYLLFSFELDLPTINAVLFSNNFSEDGVLNWLVYSLVLYVFLICIGSLGVKYSSSKFIRKVFVALILDGVISIFRALIFGYDEPFFIAPICNAIPLAYVIYSYFIYGKLD